MGTGCHFASYGRVERADWLKKATDAMQRKLTSWWGCFWRQKGLRDPRNEQEGGFQVHLKEVGELGWLTFSWNILYSYGQRLFLCSSSAGATPVASIEVVVSVIIHCFYSLGSAAQSSGLFFSLPDTRYAFHPAPWQWKWAHGNILSNLFCTFIT